VTFRPRWRNQVHATTKQNDGLVRTGRRVERIDRRRDRGWGHSVHPAQRSQRPLFGFIQSAEATHELPGVDLEHLGEHQDLAQGDVSLPSLDLAKVASMQARLPGQLLLALAELDAACADPFPELTSSLSKSTEHREGCGCVDEGSPVFRQAEIQDRVSPQQPNDGEVRAGATERGIPSAERESPAHSEPSVGETESDRPALSADLGERMLALERARDAKANVDTRPPNDEIVTFRSVTIAEVYLGKAADSLMIALGKIEFVNLDE
jgi:hypothetical protein